MSKFQMEVDAPSSKIGYSTKLFEDPQAINKFICEICNNVLRDAVQIPQSVDPKRACGDCYKNNIRYAHTILSFKKFCYNLEILLVLDYLKL